MSAKSSEQAITFVEPARKDAAPDPNGPPLPKIFHMISGHVKSKKQKTYYPPLEEGSLPKLSLFQC